MRSSLVHALMIGCTIVGFSGCYSGGGWHVPGASMLGWGGTDPDPQESTDVAPRWDPPAGKTGASGLASSGLPAPGSRRGSRNQAASYEPSRPYPNTGVTAASRSAGPYASYPNRGSRSTARNAYSGTGSSSRTSAPYKPYRSNESRNAGGEFKGTNPYVRESSNVASSRNAGRSSGDRYETGSASRYDDPTPNRSEGYRTTDRRGSATRYPETRYPTYTGGTSDPSTSPNTDRYRSSTGTDRSQYNAPSRTSPASTPRRSTSEGYDGYRSGSAARGSSRTTESGPYGDNADVNRYSAGSNTRIPGDTGYKPAPSRGDIVNGHPDDRTSRPSYETPLDTTHSSKGYRPGGTGDYRSTTRRPSSRDDAGSSRGDATRYGDRASTTPTTGVNDYVPSSSRESDRYRDDY